MQTAPFSFRQCSDKLHAWTQNPEWTHQTWLDEEHNRPLESSEDSWRLLERLHATNKHLWDLEDRVRNPALPEKELVALKRAIDQANLTRNQCIERVDHWVLALLTPVEHLRSGERNYHTESPGMILDRLSILHLRCRAFSEQSDMEARHQQSQWLLQTLVHAADQTLAEVQAGSKRFFMLPELKRYGQDKRQT